jgi:hypothetical protein
MDEQPKGLAYKMAQVMGQIGVIQKSGYNEHFKYKFAEAGDVAQAVRVLLAEQRIAFFAEMTDAQKVDGNWLVRFVFTFVDGDTGEVKACNWLGESTARDDKGINKAATAAEKYFLLKTFMIPTEDEPDADRDSKPKQANRPAPPRPMSQTPPPERDSAPPAEPQAIEVTEVVVKKGSNGKPFLSFTAGDTHVTSFTRDYLKPLIDDVTYASLATPGTYRLPAVKVFYLPSEDGKFKNVVRIEKVSA